MTTHPSRQTGLPAVVAIHECQAR